MEDLVVANHEMEQIKPMWVLAQVLLVKVIEVAMLAA
jgi:hypothetical protein